jgi:hypothetical protein
MSDDDFEQIEQAVHGRGPEAGLDFLAEKFLASKQYPQLFEARLMKKRLELGLPLIQLGSLDSVPEAMRADYEKAMVAVAREVGALYLAEGDIPRAWSYLRAVGDAGPIAAALDQIQPADATEDIIGIAYQERVNPKRGFELVLEKYGICRAITAYESYPIPQGRAASLERLVRTLHQELVASIRWAIEQREGPVVRPQDKDSPESGGLLELIAGRDWLFGQYDYYADPSHVASVLRFCLDCEDPAVLRRAVEMAEYSRHLNEQFQYKGEPPFENPCVDYGIFLRALLGENEDEAVAHFRQKMEAADPERTGTRPAEVLVELLARLGRFPEAIRISEERLAGVSTAYLTCPNTRELCQMAGDFAQLMETSRRQGDLLSFAAGLLQQQNGAVPAGAAAEKMT